MMSILRVVEGRPGIYLWFRLVTTIDLVLTFILYNFILC